MRFGKKDLACRDVVEIITAYLEGALSRRDRKRFEKHLAGCDGCTNYVEQMRKTIELTGTLTEESIPEPARAELVQLFRDWKTARA
jgi:anti-sigma factor RsiW